MTKQRDVTTVTTYLGKLHKWFIELFHYLQQLEERVSALERRVK